MSAVAASPSRTFAGTPEEATVARAWVVGRLGGRDADGAWLAELLAGELLGNAIRHTASGRPGGEYCLAVDSCAGLIWIGVTDQGAATVPTAGGLDDLDAEQTRGLALVQAMACRWGWDDIPGGRLVWCLIDTRAGSALEDEGDC